MNACGNAARALGTVFMFLFPLPVLGYLLVVKFIVVIALRYAVHRLSISE
jgi:hypothetical protein